MSPKRELGLTAVLACCAASVLAGSAGNATNEEEPFSGDDDNSTALVGCESTLDCGQPATFCSRATGVCDLCTLCKEYAGPGSLPVSTEGSCTKSCAARPAPDGATGGAAGPQVRHCGAWRRAADHAAHPPRPVRSALGLPHSLCVCRRVRRLGAPAHAVRTTFVLAKAFVTPLAPGYIARVRFDDSCSIRKPRTATTPATMSSSTWCARSSALQGKPGASRPLPMAMTTWTLILPTRTKWWQRAVLGAPFRLGSSTFRASRKVAANGRRVTVASQY